MGIITRNYDFENGTTADAEQVDAEFNTIYNEFNGNIDNANIKATAAIDVSKINLSSGITDKTRHINLTPGGATIPATNGAEQVRVDGTYHSYYALAFDPNNNELAFWHSDVPEKYSGGAIKIKISCITTVTSGNVMFRVFTRGCGENETWDSITDQTYGSVTKAVSGTAGNKFTAEITIPDPKWTYGDTIYLALNRAANDVNDTANADISVVMVTVDYEVV